MRAIPIDNGPGLASDTADSELHIDRMQLVQAACLLMGTDKSLSPADAVDDVMQVYDCVTEALERRRSSMSSIPVGDEQAFL